MLGSALVLTAIAVVFLRNQVRPIRALAEAAEAFGKGRSLPFRPAGAEEVRRAGARVPVDALAAGAADRAAHRRCCRASATTCARR